MSTVVVDGLSAFRQEVRAFLRDHLPPEMAQRNLTKVHPSRQDILSWTAVLASKGWSVPKWPVAHGGTGWSARKLAVYEEELDLAGAPGTNIQGVSLVGPVICSFGSDAQRARYLPPIRNGTEYWSQGFSEPNSGSDLASLRTRAVRDNDGYVISGQKIWTSQSMDADMCFVLARTDPTVKPQRGISFFLVSLRSPGVTVRPIRSIDEGESLCEVFFDNVRVPADSIVGEEGKGWDYAKFLLANERTTTAEVPRNKRLLARLKRIATAEQRNGQTLIDCPVFRYSIAELEIELASLEAGVSRVIDGNAHPLLPSILKVQGCELMQALQKAQIDALGPRGIVYFPQGHDGPGGAQQPPVPDHARDVVADFLFRRAATIYGGSNEIQKNIVAKMLLGETPPTNGAPRDEVHAMLEASVARFVEKSYSFEQRKSMRLEGAAALLRNWKAFAELGWLGVALPEDCGGLGGGAPMAALVAEQLGRALALEPFLFSAFAISLLFSDVAEQERRDQLISSVLAGDTLFALAHWESIDTDDRTELVSCAQRQDDGYLLSGRKAMVFGGQVASAFVLTAHLDGAVALFLVPRDTSGMNIASYRLVDGQLVVDLEFDNLSLPADARIPMASDLQSMIDLAIDQLTICACADALGAMESAFRLTREYLLIRKQFGATLASFQALQHRLAEMFAQLEQARAITMSALSALDSAEPAARRLLVHTTKAAVSKRAFFVGSQAIQLHGGVGMTEEYAVGHYFKRLLVFQSLFGDARYHTSQYSAVMANCTG
ncbi:acyl-CoA dehydrogenase family protein [Bradyrhizobium jicamae]|uniref:acyl-CoA dehydrogenase family protein n=1 Tax=Bradyrhizobium jicamae TaxID=280332 RepID=UPI001BA6BF75|nr:acyl-CoA dehydrogenase family protein [Bradyrhizobium jicamae]MBR0934275.1 acyl-CoA dehydrogenase family protein [Bradyrhizobium jicamae]